MRGVENPAYAVHDRPVSKIRYWFHDDKGGDDNRDKGHSALLVSLSF